MCIATKSNEDPKKWENTPVDVLGFATQDFTNSKGINLKSAELNVFSQETCNKKLAENLVKFKECKFYTYLLVMVILGYGKSRLRTQNYLVLWLNNNER